VVVKLPAQPFEALNGVIDVSLLDGSLIDVVVKLPAQPFEALNGVIDVSLLDGELI